MRRWVLRVCRLVDANRISLEYDSTYERWTAMASLDSKNVFGDAAYSQRHAWLSLLRKLREVRV